MRNYRLFAFLISITAASASTINYSVSSTVPDGPVTANASLTFNNSNNSLVVILTNTLSDPRSAGQLVSDIIISGLTGSSPALNTTVSADGTYSFIYGGSGDMVDPMWGFGAVSGGYEICIICPDSIHPSGKTAPPSRLIIGSGPDPNGNASIAVHSPSLDGLAQFRIDNVDPTSKITGVSISFGTEGREIAATPGGGVTVNDVPEPGAWLMAGGGLLLLVICRRTLGAHNRTA